jgi:hypothetical protein
MEFFVVRAADVAKNAPRGAVKAIALSCKSFEQV